MAFRRLDVRTRGRVEVLVKDLIGEEDGPTVPIKCSNRLFVKIPGIPTLRAAVAGHVNRRNTFK